MIAAQIKHVSQMKLINLQRLIPSKTRDIRIVHGTGFVKKVPNFNPLLKIIPPPPVPESTDMLTNMLTDMLIKPVNTL